MSGPGDRYGFRVAGCIDSEMASPFSASKAWAEKVVPCGEGDVWPSWWLMGDSSVEMLLVTRLETGDNKPIIACAAGVCGGG